MFDYSVCNCVVAILCVIQFNIIYFRLQIFLHNFIIYLNLLITALLILLSQVTYLQTAGCNLFCRQKVYNIFLC